MSTSAGAAMEQPELRCVKRGRRDEYGSSRTSPSAERNDRHHATGSPVRQRPGWRRDLNPKRQPQKG
jgi:hypothetical protein